MAPWASVHGEAAQGPESENTATCRYASGASQSARKNTHSKYCLLRRRLFRLHVRIAAGRAGRGEDLEPTASGWGQLYLRIYAGRRTNHSVGLRELVAQRLGVASLSGGWRLTLSARWTCNALLRYRLARCRRLSGSRTEARQRCNKQNQEH